MRLRHTIASIGAVVASSIAIDAQKAPALPDVLTAAADYLAEYPRQVSAIAADEVYLQYDASSGRLRTPQRLSGDIVLARLSDGIEGFRDVFAIDNAPLRPRDERLTALFTAITASALEQARVWTRESVDRYLSPNLKALDQPLVALEFLRKENQARSAFRIESVKTVDGSRVAILRFTERDVPRLVPTPGGAAALGRFWVDVASGAVRQTELGITDKTFSATATVTYARQPELGLWVPEVMTQRFDGSGPGSSPINYMGANGGYNARVSLEGRATYSRFRRIAGDSGIEQQKSPALPDILQAASTYLAEYPGKESAIAAEETYLQYDVSSGQVRTTQRLTADVVIAGLADGIETFRDVTAVDHAPFRPSDDRLPALFKTITPDALSQARAWTQQSIDRYISPNLHALDQPTLALQFLRKEHQDRSTFKVDSVKTMDGARVAIVRFTERETPRLVPTPGGAGAAGRLWIDIASGAVRQTEISITDDTFLIRASVKFGHDGALGLWLPGELFQQFDASGAGSGGIGGRSGSAGGYGGRQSLEGRARYSKFRRIAAGS